VLIVIMAGGNTIKKEDHIEAEVRYLKLASGSPLDAEGAAMDNRTTASGTPRPDLSSIKRSQSRTQSPVKSESQPRTPNGKMESVVGGDITIKLEPGKAPKLARSSSQKIVARAPPLFIDEPDMYDEATSTFEVLQDCIYAAKWLGSTEHAMDCDCREDWGTTALTFREQ
jgi:histone-lysine N-methyltransferase SETD2